MIGRPGQAPIAESHECGAAGPDSLEGGAGRAGLDLTSGVHYYQW